MKKEWILNDEQLKRRKNSRLNSLKSVGSVASIEPHSPLQQYPSLRADSIQVSQHTLPPLPNLMPLPQDIDENIVKRGGPTQHLLHSQISMAQPQLIKQTFMTSPQLNESRTSREDSTNRSNATIHQFVDDQQSLNSSSPQHKTNLISPVPSQYSQIPSMNPKTPLNILVMPFPGTSPTIELVISITILNHEPNKAIFAGNNFVFRQPGLMSKDKKPFNSWSTYLLKSTFNLFKTSLFACRLLITNRMLHLKCPFPHLLWLQLL